MKELVLRLLDRESELLHEHRAAGQKVFRPSSILIVLLALFYCTSGIDLFPERWVNPYILGLIDDLIVVIATASYTYKDWSDFSGIRLTALQFSRNRGQSEVSMGDEDETSDDSISDATSSSVHFDGDDSQAPRFTNPTLGDTLINLGDIHDSSEETTGDTADSAERKSLTPEERAARREERRRARAANGADTDLTDI